MWNLKGNNTYELINKAERKSQTQKTNLWLPQGKGQLGLWESQVHTATFKIDK